MARALRTRSLRSLLLPTAVAGLTAVMASLAVEGVPWLGHLELGMLQRRLVRSGPVSPNPSIVLVTIDEDTPHELGINRRLPLPRSYHADMLRGLKRAGAAAVVFDMTFCEPAPDEDATLRRALIDAAPMPVTLATVATAERDPAAPTGFRYTFHDLPALPAPLPRHITIGSPVAFDPGGVLDGATLLTRDAATGVTLPHIALGGVLGKLGLAPETARWDPLRCLVRAGKQSWPVGQDGELHVRWTHAQGQFHAVPYAEALASLAGDGGRAAFEGKIVLVGVADGSSGTDVHPTPLGKMSGLEFVAEVLNTLLLPDMLAMDRWRIPANTLWAWALGFGALIAIRSRRRIVPFAGPSVAIAATVVAPEVAQRFANVWIDTVGPCIAVVAACGLGGLLETSRAQGLVRRFLPRHALEGRADAVTEEATVMFVDLRGSTPLAERIGADATRDLMREVLQALADAVVRSGGEVERAMGDGLLTLFRAEGGEHHALRAVAAIPEVQRAIAPFASQLTSQDGTRPAITIGLESGMVSGAVIRAAEHEEWSSFGPTVNLAARIQGACGTLGEAVLIGPNACEAVQDRHRVRYVKTLDLKGVRDPVPVFTLQGEAE